MLFHGKRILLMRRMNFFGEIAKSLNLYFVPPKLPQFFRQAVLKVESLFIY
jgi:hypothetical protein